MVSTISAIANFSPVDYLNQIKGIKPVTPAPVVPTSPSSPSTPASSTPPTTNVIGIPSDVLSLLQGTSGSSSNGNLLSTLFGTGNSSSDPLSGLYSTLLAQDTSTLPTQEAVAATVQQQTQAAESSDPVQNVLNSYNSGLNSYNKTLLQNAQSVLQANSTPITA